MSQRYFTGSSRYLLDGAILCGLAAQETAERLPFGYPLPSLTRTYESACQLIHADLASLSGDQLEDERFWVRYRRRTEPDRTARDWLAEREARIDAELAARRAPRPAATPLPKPEPHAADVAQPGPPTRPVLPPRPLGARHGR